MRKLIAVALALCATAARAQTSRTAAPRVEKCDPAGVLDKAPEVYGARRATLEVTCGSYQLLLMPFADSSWTARQLVAYLLHGTDPFPKPPAPPATPPPADTSRPPAPPPIDTTLPPAPLGYVALRNTNPMGVLTSPVVFVPKGWDGRANVDLQKGGGCQDPPNAPPVACVAGEGAVRILSNLAFMAFTDPIAYFGQPGKSHLHQFFGNRLVGDYTTSDSITARCSSTNSGGAANCTAYWTPAMIDATGQVVKPVDYPNGTTIYYKSGYQMDPKSVKVLPTGLKMIAGDKTWTNTRQAQQVAGRTTVWWSCPDGGGNGNDYSPTIPDCIKRVELLVIFPQCWDGTNLDSPNHQSHMAYPTFVNDARGGKSTCPSTHPVVVPEITELFFWPVPTGAKASSWHISSDMDPTKPGGVSAHADWMMGWRPDVIAQLVACLNASKDVGTNGLCNGTYMNPPPL